MGTFAQNTGPEPVALSPIHIYRPQVGQESVRRPRLEDRPAWGLPRTLVLLSTIAVFGKTNLAGTRPEGTCNPDRWQTSSPTGSRRTARPVIRRRFVQAGPGWGHRAPEGREFSKKRHLPGL